MSANLLVQTIVSALLASAAVIAFLCRFTSRRPRWPYIAASVILLDHVSKWIVAECVRGGAPRTYLGGTIEIGRYTNHMQGFGGTSSWVLWATLVAIIAGIRLYQMLVERGYTMSFATEGGLALVLGAVMAIAVERAWSGSVVDFLAIGARSSHVYNLADLAAAAGLLILFARGLLALPQLIEQELATAGSKAEQ